MQQKPGYSHRFIPGACEATETAWREYHTAVGSPCNPTAVHFIPALGGCFLLIQEEPRASIIQRMGNPLRNAEGLLNEFGTWLAERNLCLSCTVVVIDDDPALLKLLEIVLQGSGCEVRAFTDARVALDAIDPSDPPAVVVVDLKMPGMDGRDFVRQLRLKDVDSRIVIASGLEAKAAQRELNADASLDKPFLPEDLLRLVQNLAVPASA